MRAIRIQAENLKNLPAIDLMIEPRTMLAGPNGSGKTALIQALTLAVLGYEPSLGKQILQVRTQLARGIDPVEAGLVFDTGFAIRRSIGGSKQTRVAPPKGERTEREMEERIKKELGGFILSLDVRELLDLTPEKRREYVFNLLPRERAQLTEERFREAMGYADQHMAIQRAIDRLWIDHVLAGETAVEGLASAIDHANAKRLEAEQVRRQKEHHRDELTKDLENAEKEAAGDAYDPEKVEALQRELEAAEADLAALTARNSTARERHQRAVADWHAKVAAERRVRNIAAAKLEAEAELARLREQLAALPEPPDDSALKETYTAALKVQKTALEAEAEQSDVVSAAREAVASERAMLSANEARLRELEGAECCPTCGGTADLDAFRDRLRSEIEKRKRAEALAIKALQTEEDRLATLRGDREKADAAVTDARDAYNEAARARQHRGVVADSIERQERALARFGPEHEEATVALRALEGVQEPTHEPGLEDSTPLTTRIHELKASIREEQARAVQGAAPETIRKQIDDAEAALAKAQAKERALKDLHKKLQELRGRVIQGMLAPVEDAARAILRQVDPEKEFRFQYDREGREVLDFGFEKDGVFRSFAAASNGESVILVTVLLAALLDDLSPPWKVLVIDNAEAIDDDPRTQSRRRFMEALTAMGDRWDNVLMAACGRSALDPVDGWKVVDVATLTGAVDTDDWAQHEEEFADEMEGAIA